MTVRPGNQTHAQVLVVDDDGERNRSDRLATEEPMEIRIDSGSGPASLAVTMRTPGNDFELATGFLFSEGAIASKDDIARISYCADSGIDEDQRYNIVTVELSGAVRNPASTLERHFYTSSACGVCGKESLDALQLRGYQPVGSDVSVDASVLYDLPEQLRERQKVFGSTGGLHAAGLFEPDGNSVTVREDVGRHNAVDKLIGWGVMHDGLPFAGAVLMVSGRPGFEIMQKALAAGIQVVCAVSAPSSLAVQVAERFNMTLIGFLRGRRFNVYSHPKRVSTIE